MILELRILIYALQISELIVDLMHVKSGLEVRNKVLKQMIIIIQDATLMFRVLLENADLFMVCGRHYGLVGRNGLGKSTLLKAIST